MIRRWFRALARKCLAGPQLQPKFRPGRRLGLSLRLESLEDRTVTSTLHLEPPPELGLLPNATAGDIAVVAPADSKSSPLDQIEPTDPAPVREERRGEDAAQKRDRALDQLLNDVLDAKPPDPEAPEPDVAPDALLEPETFVGGLDSFNDPGAFSPPDGAPGTGLPSGPPAPTSAVDAPGVDPARGGKPDPAPSIGMAPPDDGPAPIPPPNPQPTPAAAQPATQSPVGTGPTFAPRTTQPGSEVVAAPRPAEDKADTGGTEPAARNSLARAADSPTARAETPAEARPSAHRDASMASVAASEHRAADTAPRPPEHTGPGAAPANAVLPPPGRVAGAGHAPSWNGAPATPGELPDSSLLHRFVANREEAAFTALVRRHEQVVLGVCQRVLGDSHAAQDAFQATFLVLARKASILDKDRPLPGWLYKVAYHLALRLRAVAARQRRTEQDAALDRPPYAAGESTTDLERQEMRQALSEELERLPEKYRVPLVLCYFDGRTHAEAAQAVGLPRGSMAKRIGAALEQLRERLSDRGFLL